MFPNTWVLCVPKASWWMQPGVTSTLSLQKEWFLKTNTNVNDPSDLEKRKAICTWYSCCNVVKTTKTTLIYCHNSTLTACWPSIACVAGPWKQWAQEKDGRARSRHPSRVSLARARFLFHPLYFQAPATQARSSMITITKLFSVLSPIGVLRRNILCLVHFPAVMFPIVSPTCQI